jgi:hypothetical protein
MNSTATDIYPHRPWPKNAPQDLFQSSPQDDLEALREEVRAYIRVVKVVAAGVDRHALHRLEKAVDREGNIGDRYK